MAPADPADPLAGLRMELPLLLGRLIKLLYLSLARSVDGRMQPLELTAMQWEPILLLALGRADTVAGLARECNVDCGATTRMLDRLEQKQLLRRRRSDTDRRVVNLELTDKGRAVAAEIPVLVREELDRHLRGISEDELNVVTGLLARMLANAESSAGAEELEYT